MSYYNTKLWNYIHKYLKTNTFLNMEPIINSHNFICDKNCNPGFVNFVCSTCDLTAFWVLYMGENKLTCEEIIIKKIIE